MTILSRIGYGDRTGRRNNAYEAPFLRIYTGTDVAANTEISETVPSANVWLLLSVNVTLAQGAVQTPLPSLVLKDSAGNTLFTYPGMSAAMDAATTSTLTWCPNVPLTAGGALTANTAPIMAGIYLPPGSTITTSTAGIGANTNYGAPKFYVVQYS